MRYVLALFLGLVAPAFSASLVLVNDSSYLLRSVVRGNDNSYLGEVILKANNSTTWYDSSAQTGAYVPPPSGSITPYTVTWYCMDGSDFSVCDEVANASMVTAMTCEGNRQCRPPPVQPGNSKNYMNEYNQPPEEYLQPQQMLPQNPSCPPCNK